MTTKQTLEKVTRLYCDICNKEVESLYTCPICDAEICSNCRTSNQCKDCWETNSITAVINTSCTYNEGYESRNYISRKLIFDNKAKWNDLLTRFQDKKVKITFEEIKSKETINKEKRAKQFQGDDPTKFLERCG